MNANMKALLAQREIAAVAVRKLNTAINALRDICEHKWRYEGHDHKDDYYVCNECGAEEWR